VLTPRRVTVRTFAFSIGVALVAGFAFVRCDATTPTRAPASAEQLTPVIARPLQAPVPFAGSDGRVHLVYELETTNFSSGDGILERLEILDQATEAVVAVLGRAEVATRLQPAGRRDTVDRLAPSMAATLFLHVTVADAAHVPRGLAHRLTVRALAAPPDRQLITDVAARVDIDRWTVPLLSPPLAGDGYVAGDACCDAIRHTRAILPIDGGLRVAQRCAVDWEQLDGEGRIYRGAREDLRSYTIYGKEALAAADATVASVTDGAPEQVPGAYPTGIDPANADGNAVVLDLGHGAYALYAHLQPGSIRVAAGQAVRRGDVLGLVGNSGNSIAPHLHFHVMDGPSPLASNGLPYVLRGFTITGVATSTAAFDDAEATGEPLALRPVEPPTQHEAQMPLDLTIVGFRASR
jgi:Peptidase family M23